MMRKSSHVPLRLLSAFAETLRGPVAAEETRYCVDEEGRRVPDTHCEHSALGVRYHWMYGCTGGCEIGEKVKGGSREPAVYNSGLGTRRGAGA